MALLSLIRRWHFRQHLPVCKIELRTGLSRNTIRKYLRADTVEPKLKVADRPSKLDPVCREAVGVAADRGGQVTQAAAHLQAAASALKVGNAMDAGTEQGPLMDANAVSKVKEHGADALAKRAILLADGTRHALGGTFFEPIELAEVTQDMFVASEETFGPLATVIRFESEDEAIRLANDSEFELASHFYSQNLNRVWRVAEAIEPGMVCVNSGILATKVAPFGGVKQSGLGREGSRHEIN